MTGDLFNYESFNAEEQLKLSLHGVEKDALNYFCCILKSNPQSTIFFDPEFPHVVINLVTNMSPEWKLNAVIEFGFTTTTPIRHSNHRRINAKVTTFKLNDEQCNCQNTDNSEILDPQDCEAYLSGKDTDFFFPFLILNEAERHIRRIIRQRRENDAVNKISDEYFPSREVGMAVFNSINHRSESHADALELFEEIGEELKGQFK